MSDTDKKELSDSEKRQQAMDAMLDRMEQHEERLVRMKFYEEKRNADLREYLWCHKIMAHDGHLEAFWQRREQRQIEARARQEAQAKAGAAVPVSGPQGRPTSPLSGAGGQMSGPGSAPKAVKPSMAEILKAVPNKLEREQIFKAFDLHVDHLLGMKTRNESTADMLAWLRGKGVQKVHAGHLALFWIRLEAQKAAANSPATPPQAGTAEPVNGPQDHLAQAPANTPASFKGEGGQMPDRGSAPDEVTPVTSSNPSPPSEVGTRPLGRPPSPLRGEGGRRTDEVAPNEVKSSSPPPPVPISPELAAALADNALAAAKNTAAALEIELKLRSIMLNMLGNLEALVEKCRKDPEATPEERQDRDRMLSTALAYQRDQDNKAHKKQMADLKKADQELRARRLELQEQRERAREEARIREQEYAGDEFGEYAPQNGFPEDFDNTERIAAAHAAARAQWDNRENRESLNNMYERSYAGGHLTDQQFAQFMYSNSQAACFQEPQTDAGNEQLGGA
jgi:hypothetical protein